MEAILYLMHAVLLYELTKTNLNCCTRVEIPFSFHRSPSPSSVLYFPSSTPFKSLSDLTRRTNNRHWFSFGLLLLCGDIINQPGPGVRSTRETQPAKCLCVNGRSIKRKPRMDRPWNTISEDVDALLISE